VLEFPTHQQTRVFTDSEIIYQKALVDAYKFSVAELIATNGQYTQKALLNIISKISAELVIANDAFNANFMKEQIGLIEAGLKYTENEFADTLLYAGIQANLYEVPTSRIKALIDPKPFNFFSINKDDVVKKSKAYSSDQLIASIAKKGTSDVKAVILGEVVKGSSIDKIARSLKPFIIDNSMKNAKTVTRTLLSQSAGLANEEFYRENEEYVDYYLFDSVLDSRTSNICRSLSNTKYKSYSEMGFRLPLHPNERSVIVAIPEGFRVGTRPVVLPNGDIHIVKANMSYNEAVDLYPELGKKGLISTKEYFKSLS